MINIRQQKILAAVIKEHVDTAEPVSSGVLVKKCNLGVSPATIRANMKELEKEGYLFPCNQCDGLNNMWQPKIT